MPRQRVASGWTRAVTVGGGGRMWWPPTVLLLLAPTLHLVMPTPLLTTPTPEPITTQLFTTTPKETNITFISSTMSSANSSSMTTPSTLSPLMLTTISSPSNTTLIVNSSTLSPTTISSSRWLHQHTATVLQKWKQQTNKSSLWDKHLKNEKLGVSSSLSSRGRPHLRARPDDGTHWSPGDSRRDPQRPNEDLGPDLTNELAALATLPCANLSSDYILMLKDIPGPPLSNAEFRDVDLTNVTVPNLRFAVDPIEIAGLFQGDIQLSPLDHAVYHLTTANIRNAIVDLDRKWPNGVIPYVISNFYSSNERAKIFKAMQAFHEQTCIKFIPRRGHTDYIHILKDRGCSSYVGRQGGMQKLSIGYGCEFEGVIMHEMMHSTGFWHEHSRQDRDHYVRINWSNIKRGEESNFYKKDWGTEIQSLQVSYDLGSIMHYSTTAFSKDWRPTISALSSGVEIGQRRGFSKKDLEKINKLYNCPKRPHYAAQTSTTTSSPVSTFCKDSDKHCKWWASQGECRSNSYWMEEYCTKSCQKCFLPVTTTTTTTPNPPSCIDEEQHCPYWAKIGECYKNSAYMRLYCKKSCRMC